MPHVDGCAAKAIGAALDIVVLLTANVSGGPVDIVGHMLRDVHGTASIVGAWCDIVPNVPVTFTSTAPELTLMVTSAVSVPFTARTSVVLLSDAEPPELTESVSVTFPENPPMLPAVTKACVVLTPKGTEINVGDAVMVKSATFTLAVVVCTSTPLVPVTLTP